VVVTIKHTHQDGTLAYGTERGDGTAGILKANRFRWFPSIRLWGLPQSRDHLARRWLIDQAADALRAAGHEVTVEIDDTPRDVAEVKSDRPERLDGRRVALERKADRVMASAEAHYAIADEIAKRRPLGQPILIGHHSERAARADQRRIERHMDKFCEEYGQAKETARRASVVGDADAYSELPAVIIRRVAKTEAEIRRCRKWAEAGYDQAAYRDRIAFYKAQLAADRAALAEHEANGYRCHSRETVHIGDVIHLHGRTWPVVRVNTKSVSVATGYSWTDKISYERITKVDCPHETS
jgi:hypothetical protein